MIEYLTVADVINGHTGVIAQSGGASGLRDRGMLEAAVAQPQMTFGGQDLYTSVAEKAAALGFSLIMNHPFVDGNKRIGHAAMSAFLRLNGQRLLADIDEQERMILGVAAGQIARQAFTDWVCSRCQPVKIES